VAISARPSGLTRDRVRDRGRSFAWDLDGTKRPRRWPPRLAERLEGFRGEAQEYRELDDERVLVLSRYSGRGKTSGLELGQMGAKGTGVAQIRDGKVTRLVWYTNRGRACADPGLTAEGG
jgi:hypothetical protein